MNEVVCYGRLSGDRCLFIRRRVTDFARSNFAFVSAIEAASSVAHGEHENDEKIVSEKRDISAIPGKDDIRGYPGGGDSKERSVRRRVEEGAPDTKIRFDIRLGPLFKIMKHN